MAKIQVDGKTFEVGTDRSLLETCLALGFDIPYFCYHPAMGSVGACRQCAVKKYSGPDDRKGKIVMSCMEPVVDGMIISVSDPEAVAFREAVIEGLMTNHPHDCPVCDEGGECHLQDMTVMTGHAYRRYEFKKRTHRNQYLGPFIQHEMNRCIQCYRCLRFYTDYAGGTDFCVAGSGNRVYFGRHEEGALENEFSGNLVEVCPTGVFTDKTLRAHFTRKWDLTNSPSVCIHCSVGCNTLVSQRYGSVRRILSRFNKDVNGYFLCDRGRFGYEFINSEGRIRKIMIKDPSGKKPLRETEKGISAVLSPLLKGKRLIGIGSPRASLESNHALELLVGQGNFFHGISGDELEFTREAIRIMRSGARHSPSLKEIEKADAVLILGEDPVNTAPMMALAVRQASRNGSFRLSDGRGIPRWNDYPVREIAQDTRTPLFIASTYGTKLDDIATGIYNSSPSEIAAFGFRIAAELNPSVTPPATSDEKLKTAARSVAEFLGKARNPLIITGWQTRSKYILHAAANIAAALGRKGNKPSLSIIFPEANSLGTAMMKGGSIDDLAESMVTTGGETLIVLENDIYSRTEKEKADRLMSGFGSVIVIDHLLNVTGLKADAVLPCGTFAESTGTVVNYEGRAQRYYRVLPPGNIIQDSWLLLSRMAKAAGLNNIPDWKTFDQALDSLARTYPVFENIKTGMPDSGFRFYNEKIARQTLRFSGRTAMNAAVNVSEPEPPKDPDSPLKFSMEGYKGITPSDLVPYYWSPGWNSVQAMDKYINAPEEINKLSNTGVLLFREIPGEAPVYASEVPQPATPGKDELLVVPVALIFGSEELSSSSGPVRERIPGLFLLVNGNEMKRCNIAEGEFVMISVRDTLIRVQIKLNESLRDGLGGLSVLLPGTGYLGVPSVCRIENPERQ